MEGREKDISSSSLSSLIPESPFLSTARRVGRRMPFPLLLSLSGLKLDLVEVAGRAGRMEKRREGGREDDQRQRKGWVAVELE